MVMIGSSQADAPSWNPVLVRAFKKNYDIVKNDPVYVQMASTKSSGEPKIQRIVFQDFLLADPKVLLFTGSTRNIELMGVIKSSQTHEIFWLMPKTGETFTLTGKLYMAAAPTMSHRFGAPPRRVSIGSSDLPPEEFWERERLRQWKRLSPSFRASFTWPGTGESQTPREGSSVYRTNSVRISAMPLVNPGYTYTRLEAMDEGPASEKRAGVGGGVMNVLSGLYSGGGTATPSNGDATLTKEQELRCVHNSALDAFSILVFKVMRVDHVSPASAVGPPQRVVYEMLKDGSWVKEQVNP
ncbi:hypothetical protein DFS34DRAFT_648694 [Phlyctochytrium arcticum]|nr:hypothetical protein DFS34DRAFT_648694 [Phlyctochytrium arcticum]